MTLPAVPDQMCGGGEQPGSGACAWFAVRAQPKHEHIAAAHLRQEGQLEVFLPRIRFRRATRRGAVWFTEALFPGYLFARFNWTRDLRRVLHSRGVSTVIHFGDRWPTIPDAAMAELQARYQGEEIFCVPEELQPGEEVKIVTGPFQGLLAVVLRPQPGRARVAVLLEFLGRQTCIEVPNSNVIRQANPRSF